MTPLWEDAHEDPTPMPHRRAEKPIPVAGYSLGYCDGLQAGIERGQEQAFKAGVEEGFRQGFEECRRRMTEAGYQDRRAIVADTLLRVLAGALFTSAVLLLAALRLR